MSEGSSKIHVNDLFSHEVDLCRGVCQGCPLASLLFSLTTQPLMEIFKKRANKGHLTRIPLDVLGQDQFLFQLFADDTGMFLQAMEENFQEAREAFACFECILAARLNIEKTIIVPMSIFPISAWMANLGCKVL